MPATPRCPTAALLIMGGSSASRLPPPQDLPLLVCHAAGRQKPHPRGRSFQLCGRGTRSGSRKLQRWPQAVGQAVVGPLPGPIAVFPRAARSQKETQPSQPPQQPEGPGQQKHAAEALWLARLVGSTGAGGIHDQPADDRRPTPHHSALLIGGILGGLHTLKVSQMQTSYHEMQCGLAGEHHGIMEEVCTGRERQI